MTYSLLVGVKEISVLVVVESCAIPCAMTMVVVESPIAGFKITRLLMTISAPLVSSISISKIDPVIESLDWYFVIVGRGSCSSIMLQEAKNKHAIARKSRTTLFIVEILNDLAYS